MGPGEGGEDQGGEVAPQGEVWVGRKTCVTAVGKVSRPFFQIFTKLSQFLCFVRPPSRAALVNTKVFV